MEEGGGGFRPGKKDKGGEVDYKTKAGTAWSHSFLNQKPWHPLSYPNQRRKWIAEQTHSQNERRAEEVAREYAQQQDFLRQTALLSNKEKEKLEMMQAVSFLYVKPPGYNAESAKAAEVADEKRKLDQSIEESSSSMKTEDGPAAGEKKKPVPKDVFGRALPTEEQFEVLKNAPKLDTGVAGRAKPFGVEIRNVKCLRCGNYGHQSGDRECPLKDAIMPSEESRLKRDDPLTAILAQTDVSEPLKWELKQQPGMSPPRGGFNVDDPNQQIVADDNDIFDEYGGFLSEVNIPELLTNFSSSKTKKKKKKKSSKSKHTRRSPSPDEEIRNDEGSESSSGDEKRRKEKKRRRRKKDEEIRNGEGSESSSGNEKRRKEKKRRSRKKDEEIRNDEGSESSSGDEKRGKEKKRRHRKKDEEIRNDEGSESSSGDEKRREEKKRRRRKKDEEIRDEGSESSSGDEKRRNEKKRRHTKKDEEIRNDERSESSSGDKKRGKEKKRRHKKKKREPSESSPSESSDSNRRHRRRNRHKHRHSSSSEASDSDDRGRRRHRHSHRHHHQRRRHHSVSSSD